MDMHGDMCFLESPHTPWRCELGLASALCTSYDTHAAYRSLSYRYTASARLAHP
jgi:hypothetical protein